MSGAVTHLYSVVEGTADPLTIPPYPNAGQPVQFDKMPDRLWTYRVIAGGPDDARFIGYVRRATSGSWSARMPGGEAEPPEIRWFDACQEAVEWLQRRRRGG